MSGSIVRDPFERLLVDWLDETAGLGTPDYLEDALRRIDRVRQRRAWLSPGRWLPMRVLTLTRFETPRWVPYLMVIALVAILIAAIALFAGSQRRLPPPFGLATTGALAYDSGGQIRLAAADGRSLGDLPGAPPGHKFGATWSLDGTRVAFAVAERPGAPASLWVVAADGQGVLRLAEGLRLDEVQPAVTWSPTGGELAFAARGGLFVVGADGSGLRQLDLGVAASWPRWSPRGDLIAFQGPAGVHVVAPDGTGLAKVSTATGGFIAHVPSWAPDGRTLVYHAGDPGDVYVTRLANGAWTESILVAGDANDAWPSVSNSGNLVSFHRAAPQDHGYVMVAGLDGSSPRRLASGTIGWAPHCWTPDDRFVTAVSAEEGVAIGDEATPGYVLLSLDGSASPVVIPTPERQAFAACSWQRLAP